LFQAWNNEYRFSFYLQLRAIRIVDA